MKYDEFYVESIRDPKGFWKRQAQNLIWDDFPTEILREAPHGGSHWFADGRLNMSYLCIDRHLEAGHGDQVAIYYDSPVTQVKANITYQQLKDEVSKLAGGLKKLGLGKGDTAIVYMPMIPQAIYAMLACARLGRPVRALLKSRSDDALRLAQGRENNARQDLAFIGRAQFAAALMEKGMTRAMVCGALGVDKSELTRFLSVANGLPEGLAARIGRAPRAGRPRWMKLLALVHDKGETAVMAAMETVTAADSDQRFKGLLATLEADHKASANGTPPARYKSGPVNVMRSGQRLSITIDERRAPGFGVFVEERLAALLAAYHASTPTVPGTPAEARVRSI